MIESEKAADKYPPSVSGYRMLLQIRKVKIVKLTAVASEAVEKEQILNMAMLRDCHGVESGP